MLPDRQTLVIQESFSLLKTISSIVKRLIICSEPEEWTISYWVVVVITAVMTIKQCYLMISDEIPWNNNKKMNNY